MIWLKKRKRGLERKYAWIADAKIALGLLWNKGTGPELSR
jgi:hypothetical protein